MNTYQRIKGKGVHLSEGEYPPQWQTGEIQAQIRELANHRCEQCGLEFEHGTNLSISLVKGRRVIGTVHHIDWIKSNCGFDNLVYLCQACHYTIHLQGWKPGGKAPMKWMLYGLPKWVQERNLEYRMPYKQMSLFDSIGRK